MHFRWLQFAAVLGMISLHCLVAPVTAALKEMNDAMEMDQFLRQQLIPPTIFFIYEEGQSESEEAEATLELMIEEGGLDRHIPGVQVLKQKKGELMTKAHHIDKFPSLVLIRDDITAYYTGLVIREDPDVFYYWLGNAGPTRATKTLTDDNFEHLTQASTGATTGFWLVYFYHPRCMDHMAIIESSAITNKQWMNIAEVNLEANPKLEKRFSIDKCPELIYFREGKMYRYEMRKWDEKSIESFITNWFRNVKMSPVPGEKTGFDSLTENIASYLKTQLEGENRTVTLVAIVGLALIVIATSVFCCLTGGSDSKKKMD